MLKLEESYRALLLTSINNKKPLQLTSVYMFVLHFNNRQAEDIAKDFLSQSYSIIKIGKSVLVDQTWTVEILVSSYGKDIVKKIKISNKTGHIVGFE